MTAIKNGTLLVKDSNGNTARVATLSQTDITTLNTALADVGQIAVRVQAIEDKNVEQDTALDNETKARVAKDTELTNALADEQQAREQKDTAIEAKNTEQDGRLDAIETKNTEQDGRLDAIEAKNTGQASSGLELLTVLIMPLGVDETENQFRYLNGQVIMQDQFADFTSKLKARMTLFPSLFTTEENWQSEKTNSKLGQCGKFVIDDTAGTIRLPCVVNAQGLVDLASIGEIKSESLPNITGSWAGVYNSIGLSGAVSGTFKTDGSQPKTITVNDQTPLSALFDIDASRSSSTYQNNAPVQQEAIQYPYVIVVGVKAKEATKPINDYQVNNVYSFGMSQYYKGTMNNNSWLRSNNQWNSGTVYVDFYTWLLEHLNAGDVGFKSSTATDITDYDYVINTTDQTFRLPLLNGEEDLPSDNFTSFGISSLDTTGYTFTAPYNGYVFFTGWQSNITTGLLIAVNNNLRWFSGLGTFNQTFRPTCYLFVNKGDVVHVYGENGTIAINHFGFYKATGNGSLYYYAGDTLQNASLINVARIEEKLVDLSSASRGYLVESYHNGTEWYRIYSDGWIEQGGVAAAGASVVVTFPKAFSDTNYTVCATSLGSTGEVYGQCINKSSATQMIIVNYGGSAILQKSWYACGY